jgi:hypothetical protein
VFGLVLLLSLWFVLSLCFLWHPLAAFTNADAFKQLLCTPGWQRSKSLFETQAFATHSRVLCCNAGSHLKVEVDPFSTKSGSSGSDPLRWTTPADEACDLCPLGQYSSTLNTNSSCTSAARDKFVPARGMNAASSCSTTSFTNPPNPALCETCPNGWKMNRSTTVTTCVECGAGQYQEYMGHGKYYFSSGFFFLPKHQLPVSKQYTIAVF